MTDDEEPSIAGSASTEKSHVRPRLRSRNKPNQGKDHAMAVLAQDESMRQDDTKSTEQQMGAWMGLGMQSSVETEASNASMPSVTLLSSLPDSTISTDSPVNQWGDADTKTSGILKTPKYSSKAASTSQSTTVPRTEIIAQDKPEHENQSSKQSLPFVCKNTIIERDPAVRPRRRKVGKHKPASSEMQASAIEGYVPEAQQDVKAAAIGNSNPNVQFAQSTKGSADHATQKGNSNSNDDDDEDPLILGSVEELMAAGGYHIPGDPNTITDDTQMVEADISFACLAPDQYTEYQVEAKRDQVEDQEAQHKKFLGKTDIFEDDEQTGQDNSEVGPEGDDNDIDDEDDDGDGLMELFMTSCNVEEEDEDEAPEEAQPRTFLKLWNVISEWTTPQAVEWIEELQIQAETEDSSTAATPTKNWAAQVDRSDIGASRCAGLMAMLKLNLPKAFSELTGDTAAEDTAHLRRKAERRLADLLRLFDYSLPVAKLSIQEWKAMTVIILDMVLIELRQSLELNKIPTSVANIGMNKEEYVYLTRQAIRSFGRAS